MNLTTGLNRAKISTMQRSLLLASTIHSLGHDPNLYNISKDSIRRRRNKNREIIASSLKSNFVSGNIQTIHWDGKMMTGGNSVKRVERLAIATSNSNGN